VNRVLLVALIAFVGGGIVGGLMVVGGPGYARKERNDQERSQNLRRLAEYYLCQENEERDDGISPRHCGGAQEKPEETDPVTGQSYRYVSISETHFEVCATFQTDMRQDRNGGYRALYFDGQEGCMRYKRDKIGAGWVQQ
jgi:hypothetical protein